MNIQNQNELIDTGPGNFVATHGVQWTKVRGRRAENENQGMLRIDMAHSRFCWASPTLRGLPGLGFTRRTLGCHQGHPETSCRFHKKKEQVLATGIELIPRPTFYLLYAWSVATTGLVSFRWRMSSLSRFNTMETGSHTTCVKQSRSKCSLN